MTLLPDVPFRKRFLAGFLVLMGILGGAVWWIDPFGSAPSWQTGEGRAVGAVGHSAAAVVQEAEEDYPEPPDPTGQSAGPTVPGSPAAGDDPLAHGNLPRLADILEEAGDLSIPANRDRAVARMREVEARQRPALEALAKARGWPGRVERPDGSVQELAGVENGRPVYFTTHNVQAAISTGANVMGLAPFALNGAGVTVGIWDGGSVRSTHQEFSNGSRVTVMDGAGAIDHATHVGGTIAAAGIDPLARGMAPAARIDSYDWNGDKTEMTARAAAAPAESGKIFLSNHSYGYIAGWNQVWGGSPYRQWEWYGSGTSAAGVEAEFGLYNSYARDSDALAFSAPYYLQFRSAGNERTDNPQNGQTVALSPGSATVTAYDSSTHPGGDGTWRGGYENISFDALGKNVITIGSVSDAVAGGQRDPGAAVCEWLFLMGPHR